MCFVIQKRVLDKRLLGALACLFHGVAILKIQTCTFPYIKKLRAQCVAHKEKQRLNRQILNI